MSGSDRKRILQNTIALLERTPFNNLGEARTALQSQIFLGELIKEIDAPPAEVPVAELSVVKDEKQEGGK